MTSFSHPVARRLVQVTVAASVLAAGLAVQPVHAAEPATPDLRSTASPVLRLPTVVVVAKRMPVARLDTVVVTVKRSLPVAAAAPDRTAPAAAVKPADRV